MSIVLNGEERDVDAGTTVAELVDGLRPDAERSGVAVAVNGQVIRRREWGEHELQQGDDVEVVAAVQGGAV